MYTPRDPDYEPLYASTTFLSPLQSNDLSEAEKKMAREYLKEEYITKRPIKLIT